MSDYTWPSVYFAYFFFAICFALAVFFFIRSWKDGYWTKQSEDIKYQVFDTWQAERPVLPTAAPSQVGQALSPVNRAGGPA